MQLISFRESDNGVACDRWPSFPEDYRPSIRLDMDVDGKGIGYAVIIPERHTLAMIWVNPEHRGNSNGTLLLDECILRYGIDRLVAFPADASGKDIDDLISWYESKGFRLTGFNMERK